MSESENVYLDSIWKQVQSLAAEYSQELWSSQTVVFDLINHSSPRVRAAAVLCGYAKWKLGGHPNFQALCCRIVATDDGQPRGIAIIALAQSFYNTKNRDIERVLTPIIRDRTASNDLRNRTYRALREIEFGFEYEIEVEKANENAIVLRGGSIPLVEVDWALLDLIDGY